MLKLALIAQLLAAISPVVGETVHGVVVFSRHGDRTSKHYSGYTLTPLGAQQNFQVGSDYRARYLSTSSPQRIFNMSLDRYIPSQVYASAPDQTVLLNTATAFLQGLYPPIGTTGVEVLNNGTSVQSPLDGYQYVVLHGEDDEEPDTIWIKGDDGCPNLSAASESFEDSAEFEANVNSTRSFYSGFWDILQNVYDYTPENLTYAKAYDIFDLINTAMIHNESIPRNVSSDEMFQLRTLANSAEFGYNFNASEPDRMIGGQTLTGGLFKQLNSTVSSKGKVKFSLLAGSYDTFMAFFGLANLTSVSPDFYGLPDYAASMAFELFTTENTTAFPSDLGELNVRFLFRNGSTGALTQFPLFGRSEDVLSWADFSQEMQSRAIADVGTWCERCASTDAFCAAYTSNDDSSSGGISNAVAGVIGAMVTLGVVAIVGAAAFCLLRRRKATPSQTAMAEKGSMSSGSGQ